MSDKYSSEFKHKVIVRYEKGESIKQLSQELYIAQSTIYHWRKMYRTIQTPHHTYTHKEFGMLSTRLAKLEHEMEIIQLSGCLEEVPLRRKLEVLEKIYHENQRFSVHELCEALGVARGTFYNHIFRRADWSKREKEQGELMLKVQQIFDDSQQRYGAEKIRAVLIKNGVQVSAKRIAAIMQELNLRSIRTDAQKQYKKKQQYEKRNLLQRQFTAQRPNEIWVSDITYFKINGYWVYLCIILDLFYARRIVGYRVSRNASTILVTATFRNAYLQRGKQYTSVSFTKLLKNGVQQSFSVSGRPCDNAVAATFRKGIPERVYLRAKLSQERGAIYSIL